jgi:hypothetical protein
LRVKCRCFSAFYLIIVLPLLLYHAYHCFLHLLSTNHKCTQPCYFPMLLKLAAQKLKKIWCSSMRSSRQAITPGQLPVELWSLPLLYYRECSIYSFVRQYSCNKYIILRHWLLCIHFLYGMCVNLIPGHTYYEHSVWPENRV